MTFKSIVLAALWLGAIPAASGADGMAVPAQRPLRTLPDCWVEHTQVQPSSIVHDQHADAVSSTRIHLMTDRHLGAEHPGDRRTRPCSILAPRRSASGPAAPVPDR